jgi:hypothetical protein
MDHINPRSKEALSRAMKKAGCRNLKDWIAHPEMYPSPSAVSYGTNQGGAAGRTGPVRPSLQTMARKGLWSTPRAVDGPHLPASMTETIRQRIVNGKATLGETTMAVAGGQLNPMWVEWLMGFPLGHTDLKPLAMDKYRLWLQQHGRS